jgi:hypothetical protein
MKQLPKKDPPEVGGGALPPSPQPPLIPWPQPFPVPDPIPFPDPGPVPGPYNPIPSPVIV